MTMSIRTEIFPMRASMRKKDSWELIVEVKNEDEREKMVSLRIELPQEANFSTVGLTKTYEKNIEKFRKGGTAQFKMPIYMSNRASVGSYMGKLKVNEHFHDFEHVERTYSKEIHLRIVE